MLFRAEDDQYWNSIAQFRKKVQRLPLSKVIFIDQTQDKIGAAPRRGLAPAGEEAKVVSEQATHFPARVDFMGALCANKTLSHEILTPEKRGEEKVKGWRKSMILDFLRDKVADDANALGDDGVTVVLDKALRVKPEEALQALHDRGGDNVKQVLIIPRASGKHLSPLDNCLWAKFKQKIARKSPQTVEDMVAAMEAAWASFTKRTIWAMYRHCALTRKSDPYKGR